MRLQAQVGPGSDPARTAMSRTPKGRRPRLVLSATLVAAALGLGLTAVGADREPSGVDTRVLDGTAHPPPDGYELVFSEDFDEPLDPDLWGRCFWWDEEACRIASNEELQVYEADNVTVDDEVLRLEAREETVVDDRGQVADGAVYDYTSGLITTGAPLHDEPARLDFTYGYVEARLRLPVGQGLWSAFWLLPADQVSRPEIDVIETLGHEPQQAEWHYHYVDAAGERRSAGADRDLDELADGDWHEFAVHWEPGRITWIVDGRAWWEVSGEEVSDEAMYLVLNLAVGGEWPGSPDETTGFPAAVEAEWVRVWQPA